MKIFGNLLLAAAIVAGFGCSSEKLDFTVSPQENITAITDDNFDKEVLESGVPVLVDFWAPWCGPCLEMNPILAELAREYKGRPVKFGALNVSENRKSAEQYDIKYIPHFIVFKDGKVVGEISGKTSKEKLKRMIERSMEK